MFVINLNFFVNILQDKAVNKNQYGSHLDKKNKNDIDESSDTYDTVD